MTGGGDETVELVSSGSSALVQCNAECADWTSGGTSVAAATAVTSTDTGPGTGNNGSSSRSSRSSENSTGSSTQCGMIVPQGGVLSREGRLALANEGRGLPLSDEAQFNLLADAAIELYPLPSLPHGLRPLPSHVNARTRARTQHTVG